MPDPVYSDANGTHYKKLEDVIGTETTEKDCPSSQKQTVTAVAEEQQVSIILVHSMLNLFSLADIEV